MTQNERQALQMFMRLPDAVLRKTVRSLEAQVATARDQEISLRRVESDGWRAAWERWDGLERTLRLAQSAEIKVTQLLQTGGQHVH